jgi:hypothetical protein
MCRCPVGSRLGEVRQPALESQFGRAEAASHPAICCVRNRRAKAGRQRVMWTSRVVVLACVAWAAGCSSDANVASGITANDCAAEPGSPIDLSSEPDWRQHAEYREWTDADGCLVRIDIVAERPGPDHCDWEDADVLIVGNPLGEPYTSPSDTLHFVRDPNGVFGVPELAEGFDAEADLPADAVDTGFRRDGVSLWHVPGNQSQVWLVSESSIEKWPGGDTPLCA